MVLTDTSKSTQVIVTLPTFNWRYLPRPGGREGQKDVGSDQPVRGAAEFALGAVARRITPRGK